jgi:uncharacterized protein (TIGR02145 family)
VKKILSVIGWVLILASLPSVAKSQLTDIDGNTYKTVQIGHQLWMAENLRTAKYSDGTEIPLVTGSEWYSMTTPGYSWYNNNYKIFGKIYGALYNWYAVETGNLCPTGWHVPTDDEWTALSAYLGGDNSAGGKLKEKGTAHWKSPNGGATNNSGFNALPGGGRWVIGRFDLIYRRGYWWSSSGSEDNTEAMSRMIGYEESIFKKTSSLKGSGFSVRCIKDK